MKHTPGPWYYGSDLELKNFSIDQAQGVGVHIAVVTSCQEDARLIAAAPEMLEALERIIALNGSTGGAESLVKEFKFIATQAIAKAKGEK